MVICFVGASGHFMYAIDDLIGDESLQVGGYAPGSAEEDMKPLAAALAGIGCSAPYFHHYTEMFDQVRPDVAVINCFFYKHAEVALQALQRNIHIFIEKPVATNLQDLAMIRKCLHSSGVRLCAMFGLRYTPWFYTAWQAVRQGEIGSVLLMSAQKSYKLGIRGDHYRRRKTYGGTIPWVGSHAIDWLYWFSDTRFSEVTACHSSFGNHDHGELEMTALAQFRLGEHICGSVQLDYLRPDTAPCHADDRLRVAGTEGVIEIRQEKVYLINLKTEGELELQLQRPSGIFSNFLASIHNESACLISAEDSLYISEISLQARISADLGRTIQLGP